MSPCVCLSTTRSTTSTRSGCGPPNKTLPWRARYVAYGVGLVVFVLLQMVERRLGIGLGFFSLAYSILATVGLTRLVLSVVDHDRPLGRS